MHCPYLHNTYHYASGIDIRRSLNFAVADHDQWVHFNVIKLDFLQY